MNLPHPKRPPGANEDFQAVERQDRAPARLPEAATRCIKHSLVHRIQAVRLDDHIAAIRRSHRQ